MLKNTLNTFSYQVITDREDIAKYFESLIKSFKSGKLPLTAMDKVFMMKPSDLINFSIEAKTRRNKSSLTLNIEWQEDNSTLQENNNADILDEKEHK